MELEFDLRKYGLYVWLPEGQRWVLVYFGFKQVIVDLRDDYRAQNICTCVVKKTKEEMYNIHKEELA